MKNLILILFTAASLNLSCAPPQKFEANLAVANINNNQPDSEVQATPTDAFIFTISEDGKVFLQKKDKTELLGTTSETEKLRQSFTALLKEKADKTVFVRAPRAVKYGDVSAVIDLLKSAGAKPIGLSIEGLEQ
ncbi:MAG TPA: biopolymer transporter ExbD [Pyrinomonadaceae bacterium]|nr:biopolymer transporter ExbD [Pyrinomonadaceae bacterium]